MANRTIDSRIEPIRFHPRDFCDENPLVWEIKTKGIPLIRKNAPASSAKRSRSLNYRAVVNYWHKAAREDWKMVQYLFCAKRYSYALAFARPYLEKMLKAVIVRQTRAHAPFRRSLPELAEIAGLALNQEQRELLDRVDGCDRQKFDHPDAIDITRKHTRKFTQAELERIDAMGRQLAARLTSSKRAAHPAT